MTTFAYLSKHADDTADFFPANRRHQLRLIDESALEEQLDNATSTLLIGSMCDQKLLAKSRVFISNFLHRGGTIVFNGHIVYPFIDDLLPYVPLPRRGKEDLLISPIVAHPIFANIDFMDLSERRGVRGFYGRGANPMPRGAQAINRVGANAVIDWQLDFNGGGRLFVHSGNDMWMYHNDASSAAKVTPQLLNWCAKEIS